MPTPSNATIVATSDQLAVLAADVRTWVATSTTPPPVPLDPPGEVVVGVSNVTTGTAHIAWTVGQGGPVADQVITTTGRAPIVLPATARAVDLTDLPQGTQHTVTITARNADANAAGSVVFVTKIPPVVVDPPVTDWSKLPGTTGCKLPDSQLTRRSGQIVIPSNGLLERILFDNAYVMTDRPFTVRDCKGTISGAPWAIMNDWKYDSTIERCTFNAIGAGMDAVFNTGGTNADILRSLDITPPKGGDGWKWGNNTLLEDIVVHGRAANPSAGEHADSGGQVMSARGLILRRFYIDGGDGVTSALMIRADTGNVANVLVEDGYIGEGNVGQPCIYADQVSGNTISNTTIRRIRAKKGEWKGTTKPALQIAGGVTVSDVEWYVP